MCTCIVKDRILPKAISQLVEHVYKCTRSIYSPGTLVWIKNVGPAKKRQSPPTTKNGVMYPPAWDVQKFVKCYSKNIMSDQ